jgi:hypothetical protein
MLIKVIYPDGSSGTIRSSSLGKLSKEGGIVAFKCTEGWVEVRRKHDTTVYEGPERRVIIPFH